MVDCQYIEGSIPTGTVEVKIKMHFMTWSYWLLLVLLIIIMGRPRSLPCIFSSISILSQLIFFCKALRIFFSKLRVVFELAASMSTPAQYYQSLPPVSKAYGMACLMTSTAFYLGLFYDDSISLDYELVIKHFQIWRLFTNFFFLGPFSLPFAFRLLIIARYGVLLERGPFDKRTADYVWMFIFGAMSLLVISVMPFIQVNFLGASLVFMIVYVWAREFTNAQINFYGLVTFRGFYLPWTMLAVDLLLGNRLLPDILGMLVGHAYYFATVLYPLASGKNFCKTPYWVHKLVTKWGRGAQVNSPVVYDPSAGISAFRGRGYRLGGTSSSQPLNGQAEHGAAGRAAETHNQASRQTFSGRSYRLNDS